jgi:hypothetical protein
MTSHVRSRPDDPSPSRVGARTVAVSTVAALLVGLAQLAQTAASNTHAIAPRAEPAAPATALCSGPKLGSGRIPRRSPPCPTRS